MFSMRTFLYVRIATDTMDCSLFCNINCFLLIITDRINPVCLQHTPHSLIRIRQNRRVSAILNLQCEWTLTWAHHAQVNKIHKTNIDYSFKQIQQIRWKLINLPSLLCTYNWIVTIWIEKRKDKFFLKFQSNSCCLLAPRNTLNNRISITGQCTRLPMSVYDLEWRKSIYYCWAQKSGEFVHCSQFGIWFCFAFSMIVVENE